MPAQDRTYGGSIGPLPCTFTSLAAFEAVLNELTKTQYGGANIPTPFKIRVKSDVDGTHYWSVQELIPGLTFDMTAVGSTMSTVFGAVHTPE